MYNCILFLCGLLLFPNVENFDAGWPTDFSSSEDMTHYLMTECALLELAVDYLERVYDTIGLQSVIGDRNLPCQAKAISGALNAQLDTLKIDRQRLEYAIETIAQSNTRRDLVELSHPATHFDNEQFDDGARLISQLLHAAVSSTSQQEYQQARQSFGSLLHTVQDFYSHSNWIEIGHRVPNRGIGKYEILGRYASIEMRTCDSCQNNACRRNILRSILENNILTSGYYHMRGNTSAPDAMLKPTGKCSHGGAMDLSVSTDATGGGINKDTLDSDHGHLHNVAASVAYNATKQILHEFWTMIGNERFGQFLGLSSNFGDRRSGSLIFVIDTTGSMGPYIEMAKRIASQVANLSQTLDYSPSSYILSPFNDPHFGPLTVSINANEFTSEISKLRAKGGGDGPELCYHGIVEALKKCEVGSQMYIFTDAPAKDAYLRGLSIQLAREKRVTVTLFYGRGDYQEQISDSSLAAANDDMEYLDSSSSNGLSWLTGGVTMGIDSETLNATENYIVQRLSTAQLQRILLAKNLKSSFVFDVDPTMTSLRIEVTSTRPLGSGSIELTKSSGDTVLPTLIYSMPFIHIYNVSIASDESGEWTLRSLVTDEHTIELNTASDVHCSSTLQKRVDRSFSDMSFTPLTSQPVKGQTDLFVLTVCQNLPAALDSGYVNLIDEYDGSSVRQTLLPISISSTGFLTRITIPIFSFRLSAAIRLINGTIIQRQQEQLITPTSVSLTLNHQPYLVGLNGMVSLNYTLYNHGVTPQMICFRVNDTLGLLWKSNIQQTYTIPSASSVNGTAVFSTNSYNAATSNSTIVTDTVVFSATGPDNIYDELVPVYIIRNDTALRNQSDYQVPPTASGNEHRLESWLAIVVILLFSTKECLPHLIIP